MRSLIFTFLFLLISFYNTSAQVNLFGLTRGEAGRIIKYNAANNNLSTAHTLNTDKAVPWYNDLLQASDGRLYGMTENGGANNYGILFSYDPVSNIYKKLIDFDGGSNGKSPYGSLIEVSNGVLYGMTQSGGATNHGTIFSYNVTTNRLTPVHHFNGSTGRSPYGSLVKATDGNLYGMTESGGVNDYGTLFSFNTTTKEHKVLYNFSTSSGRSPYGSLIQATDGKLYGLTQFGGANGYGSVFSISPGQPSSFEKINDFNWSNGAWPNSTLVQGSNTKLYGMTESGGVNNYGVIFSLDIPSKTISNLYDFNELNGRSPYGKLFKASDNLLYGMTYRGGNADKGVLFSYNPAATVAPYKKLTDFNGTNGLNPAASLIELKTAAVLPLTLLNFTVKENNKKVQLEWLVESESDINKYEIERSFDGIHFSSIGFVTAINSQVSHKYSFTDHQPASHKNYYRLKIHEYTTSPHYSAIKQIMIDGTDAFKALILQNPVTTNTKLKITLPAKTQLQLKLYNTQGFMVQQWPSATFDMGEHVLPVQLQTVPAGNYLLIIETGTAKQVLQLIKITGK